tara:strand:+ start:285 stop:1118 length:834 start_codon:yes stop_codon:yes gene_type:complete
MAELRDLDSGKIYIGPVEPKKEDRSLDTLNGGKPYDGTLAVTGPAFIGGHSKTAHGVLNVGVDLGDFSPVGAGRAVDVEGDVRVTGNGGGAQGVDAVVINGDVFVTGRVDCGNKGKLASRFSSADARPKPFDIKHPSREGYRLRYACIEGPEVAVYHRGRLRGNNIIQLPYYWKDLVHEDSITVELQPIGKKQYLIVESFNNREIVIKDYHADMGGQVDCFFHVYGERKDINPLITEYKGNSWEDYPDPNFNPDKVDEDKRNYNDPNYRGDRNTITM